MIITQTNNLTIISDNNPLEDAEYNYALACATWNKRGMKKWKKKIRELKEKQEKSKL